MKTSSFPSVRVAPELRQSAENVLQEGETLSSFVELAIRAGIEHRKAEREFIARGLTARDNAQRESRYIDSESVIARLDKMLSRAKTDRSSTKA